jgi:HEAT repeat protein
MGDPSISLTAVLLVAMRDIEAAVRVQACLALGRLADASAIPALESALDDPAREVRTAACGSLCGALRRGITSPGLLQRAERDLAALGAELACMAAQLRSSRLAESLRFKAAPEQRRYGGLDLRRSDDGDPAVSWLLAAICSQVPDLLDELARSTRCDAAVRNAAAWVLARSGWARCPDVLAALLGDRDATVRAHALWLLGRVAPSTHLESILAMMSDPSSSVRREALSVLSERHGDIENANVEAAILAAIDAGDEAESLAALDAASRRNLLTTDILARRLRGSSARVRIRLVEHDRSQQLPRTDVESALMPLLAIDDGDLGRRVVEQLIRYNDAWPEGCEPVPASAIPGLVAALDADDRRVQLAAARVLLDPSFDVLRHAAPGVCLRFVESVDSSKLDRAKVEAALTPLLATEDPAQAVRVVTQLVRCNARWPEGSEPLPEAATPGLLACVQSAQAPLAIAAAEPLVRAFNRAVVVELIRLLVCNSRRVRKRAAELLASLDARWHEDPRARDAIPWLEEAVRSSEPDDDDNPFESYGRVRESYDSVLQALLLEDATLFEDDHDPFNDDGDRVRSHKDRSERRAEALFAWARLGDPAVAPFLLELAMAGEHKVLVTRSLRALGPAAAAALSPFLRGDSARCLIALDWLVELGMPPEPSVLGSLLESADADLRIAVLGRLPRIRSAGECVALVDRSLLDDDVAAVRTAAARIAASHPGSASVAALMVASREPEESVRRLAVVALAMQPGSEVCEHLLRIAVVDRDEDVRHEAEKAVAAPEWTAEPAARPSTIDFLVRALRADDAGTRARAAWALGLVGERSAR